MAFTVAIVSRDPEVRLAAARAFAPAPAEWSVELHEEVPERADVVVYGSDLATGESLVFDPARPEDALRALEARLVVGRTYAVAGAVGGAGATAVALHLAAEWGRGSCYAELAGPGGAAWFDLPADARTWLPRDDDLLLSALPVSAGFRVLRAPVPCPEPGGFPLEVARSSFERLVLDVGTRGLPRVDAAVLVTTPTRPAARAARALIESHPDTRWAVVVNRLGPGGQIMRAGLEALIGRPASLELPTCAALRDAEDEGRLVRRRCHRWQRGVARLARALEPC
jgi:hypothetical protein